MGAEPVLPASAGTRGPDGLTDEERRKAAEGRGVDFSEYQPTAEELEAQKRARAEGNNPAVRGLGADEKPAAKDPTLTDMLLRDVASGKVRRARAGARRMTFGGSFNPYDTPGT